MRIANETGIAIDAFTMIYPWEDEQGKLSGVEMKKDLDPGNLYYKGTHGGSGWPYIKTKLPRERYEEAQAYRNSLRPEYR